MSNRKPIFDAIKAARGGKAFLPADVIAVDSLLDFLGIEKDGDTIARPAPAIEPEWLVEARKFVGTSEIPGPRHNSWIVAQWAKLGASWFNDDETPWCGLFVAHCMQAAGLSFPGKGAFARALAWKDWGKPCPAPLLGAVAVFGRSGGGHVAFVVGEDAEHLHVLGGNQSNAVNVMAIAKSRLVALRWPSERALGTVRAPRRAGGVVSGNEA